MSAAWGHLGGMPVTGIERSGPRPLRSIQLPGVASLTWFHSSRRHWLRRVPFVLPTLMRVAEGDKRIVLGQRDEALGGDRLMAVSAGTELDLENRPDPRSGCYAGVVLAFDRAYLRRYEAPTPASRADPWIRPGRWLDQAWRHLIEAWDGGAPESLLVHRVGEVVIALREQAVGLPLWLDSPGQAWAERVRALILPDPGRPWAAPAVAQRLNVSESTLRRHLTREATSFRALLEEARLLQGLCLLQDRPQKIGVIAARCGYESASRFSERFQRRLGLKPSELRAGDSRPMGPVTVRSLAA
ncbi:MAG: helix-turn-helix transcriptional regulator [Burkholderiaceae bacterium]